MKTHIKIKKKEWPNIIAMWLIYLDSTLEKEIKTWASLHNKNLSTYTYLLSFASTWFMISLMKSTILTSQITLKLDLSQKAKLAINPRAKNKNPCLKSLPSWMNHYSRKRMIRKATNQKINHFKLIILPRMIHFVANAERKPISYIKCARSLSKRLLIKYWYRVRFCSKCRCFLHQFPLLTSTTVHFSSCSWYLPFQVTRNIFSCGMFACS